MIALFQSQLNDAIYREDYEDAVISWLLAGATENDIVGIEELQYILYLYAIFICNLLVYVIY